MIVWDLSGADNIVLMWAIRFILPGLSVTIVCIGRVLLRQRSRYEELLETGPFNYFLVAAYNVLSWLTVVLPPAGGWDSRPDWMEYLISRIGSGVVGSVLIFAVIVLFAVTLRQRKVLGAQDVKEGLLTTGAYRYFRHPIYTGILCVCLGLGLVTRNPDGRLFFPALFAINLAHAVGEERKTGPGLALAVPADLCGRGVRPAAVAPVGGAEGPKDSKGAKGGDAVTIILSSNNIVTSADIWVVGTA